MKTHLVEGEACLVVWVQLQALTDLPEIKNKVWVSVIHLMLNASTSFVLLNVHYHGTYRTLNPPPPAIKAMHNGF